MTDSCHNPSSVAQILRAQWHDYRDRGFYMLTMVTEGRTRTFGQLKGEREDSARIELSPLGKALEQSILAIPDYYPEVEIIDHVVMEDHCHICLQVKETMRKHLGAVVRALKSVTTKAYLKELDEREGGYHLLNRDLSKGKANRLRHTEPNAASDGPGSETASEEKPLKKPLGEAASEKPLSEAASEGPLGMVGGSMSATVTLVSPLWAQGYHDRIVTRRGQIAAQKAYIRRNPGRLWAKRHADKALTRVSDVQVPISLPLAQRLKDAAAQWDQRRDVLHSQFSQRHDGRHYAESYLELTQKFLRKKIIKKATSLVASSSAAGSEAAGKAKGSAAASKAAGKAASEPLQPFLKLRVCGNRDLLFSGRPMVRVRISRSITEAAFREEAERILALCEREGAVAVSPFRSWSEKMVLRMIRANGYDHVIVHGESMWEGWKPQDGSTADMRSQYVPEWAKADMITDHGDLAEVYAGRCVFIAPWADRPKGERAGKADCELMNEMSAVLELAQSNAE